MPRKGERVKRLRTLLVWATAVAVFAVLASTVSAARLPGTSPGPKTPFEGEDATVVTPITEDELGPGVNNPQPGYHDNGRGGNTFVNDPCIDPPPTAPPPENRRRTVQSETELAVFDRKFIVAGYNDSFGFYDNTQGLAGYAYSINGGNSWVDGGGLPPRVPAPGVSPFTPGVDGFFGDPVIVVDENSRTFTKDSSGTALATPIQQEPGQFYYAAIYKNPSGVFTLSVSRGRFMVAPPTTPETESNTRCFNDPTQFGVPDPPENKERIVWERPIEAVVAPFLGPTNQDFLDKEWLHVDQRTGTLYLTYTRFATDGSTPIELVRSFDGGRTWTPPSVIVENELTEFNQGTYPVTVGLPDGGTRVVVFWWARTFSDAGVTDRRIEYAVSNDDGNTFGPEQLVATVFRQSEAPGYNRRRTDMFNPPFADVRGNKVYVTFMSGKAPGNPPATGASSGPRPSDIFLSTSVDGGMTFGPPVKVNDDEGRNTHVFPNVRVSKQGFVFVSWLDRRNDLENELTDAWAAVSKDGGATFGHNKLQTDVATSWRVRADARPNFGDYNSSDLLGDNQFVIVWADGRFPPPAPAPQGATPDTIFTIAQGLGVGNDPNPNNP